MDVIQIAQHHKMYVALDPVVAPATGGASPAYQYYVKKKSLSLATEILRKGTKALSLSSSDKEREFHRALSSLRQRWGLRRTGGGAIVGDLSYHSGMIRISWSLPHLLSICHAAGSMYHRPVFFEVTKAKVTDSKSVDSAADVINVTIPREWRGSSEILVFLTPKPVQGVRQCVV